MAFSKLNYVNVGPHGTFKRSGGLHTTPQDIDALFEYLARTGVDKLAVHFHGGLVPEGRGEMIARSMQTVFEKGNAHGLTFIWETGLVETLMRNVTRVNQTRFFQKLVRYVFRQLSKRLGGDLSGRGPGEPMTMSEIEAELSRIDKFEALESAARGGADRLDEADLEFALGEMELEFLLELQGDTDLADGDFDALVGAAVLDPSIAHELRDETGRGVALFQVAKYLARITYRVLKRYVDKRDHGLYPTVIEEILREFYLADFGAWTWGRMKDVAAEMWLPNGATLDENSHPGTYFLHKLKAHQERHPGFKVDLVGHSAGSIAICHMLHAGDAAGVLPDIRAIIFLAPACLTRLLHDEIIAHPERYDTFRMFTMADALEQKDPLVPGVYTRSLLYFISGVLEDEVDTPLAGMARFWSGTPPFNEGYLMETARWLLAETENRAVLSKTPDEALEGLRTTSGSHGGFDDDEPTRGSITHLVAKP